MDKTRINTTEIRNGIKSIFDTDFNEISINLLTNIKLQINEIVIEALTRMQTPVSPQNRVTGYSKTARKVN